jgi:hypothetical protein
MREEDSSEERSSVCSGSSSSGEEEESFTSDESSEGVTSSDSMSEENGVKCNGNGTRLRMFPRECHGLAIQMGNNYSSITQHCNGKKRKGKRRETIPLRLDDAVKFIWEKVLSTIVVLELYISNMPSLVGSLALAWSSLGVDWFKVRTSILCCRSVLIFSLSLYRW